MLIDREKGHDCRLDRITIAQLGRLTPVSASSGAICGRITPKTAGKHVFLAIDRGRGSFRKGVSIRAHPKGKRVLTHFPNT